MSFKWMTKFYQIFVELKQSWIFSEHAVFLFQFFIDFSFELGKKLLQKIFDLVPVFDLNGRPGRVDEMKGRAGAIMHHNLELNLGFPIWE